MMRYLITRPQPRADAFAEALRARGYDALIAPLQVLRIVAGAPVATDAIAAIAVSSASAVAALAERRISGSVPLFAIGPQTAASARAAGFADVRNADGDRLALAARIARDMPAGSRILHATGRGGADLPLSGYAVERLELYEMSAETRLPAAAAKGLRDGLLDGVFLFSPKGAEIFRDCVLAGGLGASCVGLDAYCISAAAAFFLRPLRFAQICVAKAPNRDAMLDMLPKFSP